MRLICSSVQVIAGEKGMESWGCFPAERQRLYDLIARTRPRVAVPIHDEGWSHFRSDRTAFETALASAPADVRARVRILPLGAPTALT